jgi:hypothetical protein
MFYRRTFVEARVGIEPTHKGFADLSLTTWVPRLICCSSCSVADPRLEPVCARRDASRWRGNLERETGVEPATSSLARKHSTTELLPPCQNDYNDASPVLQSGAYKDTYLIAPAGPGGASEPCPVRTAARRRLETFALPVRTMCGVTTMRSSDESFSRSCSVPWKPGS